jgi:opacity protein-like surface antigen
MRRLSIAGAILAMFLCGPGVTQAQWSAGGSLGIPDADIDVAVYDPPLMTADDSSPVSWKLFVGYAFSQNVGLEAGYTYLGSEYQLFNILGYGERITFEPSAAFVTLVGLASVHDRVHVIARLGVAYWTTHIDYAEGAFRSSGRDGDVDPVLGIGFEIDLTERVGLRFEWEQFQNVGDDVSVERPAGSGSKIELGSHDISTTGVGLKLRF